MTREIIVNLLTMNLDDNMKEILHRVIRGEAKITELNEELIDEGMEQVRSMLAKQIYILNPDLIAPASKIIESENMDQFLFGLHDYFDAENHIHTDYNDRCELDRIYKQNPQLFNKWYRGVDPHEKRRMP